MVTDSPNWEPGIWAGKAEIPREWRETLSEFWGAKSLHGSVFRQPRGCIWWHCAQCRMPSNPAGTRSLTLPARGAAQMEAACYLVQHMHQRDAEMGMIHGRRRIGGPRVEDKTDA